MSAKWLHAKPASYWQRGCDDAKVGKPYLPPTAESEFEGYRNGYDYGKTTYQMPAVGKRILARELGAPCPDCSALSASRGEQPTVKASDGAGMKE